MYAMHYQLPLPADYDMTIIRRRVAERGHALDAFPGLGLKAYLIRERGVAGSAINEYAPFYLWASSAAATRFLWGGAGFGGLVAGFGRPAVQQWLGIAFHRGPAYARPPVAATRSHGRLPPDVDPQSHIEALRQEAALRSGETEVHSIAYAVDPGRWDYVRFTLWATARTGDAAEAAYQVLHLSTPELDTLAVA